MPRPLRMLSWNVNGLRACARKGFLPWLEGSGAWLVGLQEVRALREQLADEVAAPHGWQTHFVAAERKGYSGVALYCKATPDEVTHTLGRPEFDREGRLVMARFGRLVVANGYSPKGSGNERDNGRVAYKLRFYRALFTRLERLRRGGKRVIVMGDFNTAHREVDLARPKDNRDNSGFLPEERAEFDRWIAAGWTDTFRRFEPGAGHYSWWSQRFGVRERNVGWRIDYVLASPPALRHVRSAFIHPDVRGSDHCPVGIDAAPTIVGRSR